MALLYWLESLRTPFWNEVFALLTHLGDETVFLAVCIIVCWCINRRTGIYLLATGLLGTGINQFLKISFRIPRPWVQDPAFTVVEGAQGRALGYSFPSGHTQSAATVFGGLARTARSTAGRIAAVAVVLLVASSRMYLGVHTPLDVGVSLLIGAVLVFGLYPIIGPKQPLGRLRVFCGSMVVLSLAFVLYAEWHAWPVGVDAENLAETVKNSYLLFGCSIALLLASLLEPRYARISLRAPLLAQIAKVLLGLVPTLALKEGLKPVLAVFFGEHLSATAVRYFFVAFFALCIWPLTFGWFERGCPLGRRARKALRICGIVLLVLLLLAGGLLWLVRHESREAPISTAGTQNPLVTPLDTAMVAAHRAGGGIAPENTMMALRSAAAGSYRCDIFEFDFYLTADAVPVLLHDGTLDRTSNAVEHFGQEGVAVGSRTLAELRELNMGETFTTPAGETPYAGLRGEAIPDDLRIVTLEEALTFLEGCGEYRYIIEIKDGGERGLAAADILYSTLQSLGCAGRTVVGTFHAEVTEYLTAQYADLPRSASMPEVISFYLRALFGLPDSEVSFTALQIPPEQYGINLATTRLVNAAHRQDIAVQYWTVNDMAQMQKLQAIGADCIITDLPDLASDTLAKPE